MPGFESAGSRAEAPGAIWLSSGLKVDHPLPNSFSNGALRVGFEGRVSATQRGEHLVDCARRVALDELHPQRCRVLVPERMPREILRADESDSPWLLWTALRSSTVSGQEPRCLARRFGVSRPTIRRLVSAEVEKCFRTGQELGPISSRARWRPARHGSTWSGRVQRAHACASKERSKGSAWT